MFIAPLFNKIHAAVRPRTGRAASSAWRSAAACAEWPVRDGRLAPLGSWQRLLHAAVGTVAPHRVASTPCLLALNGDEIEAVLAHELGHFAKRHHRKRVHLQLWRARWCSSPFWAGSPQQPWFYVDLGVPCRNWAAQRRHGAAAVLPGHSCFHFHVHAVGQLVLAPRQIRSGPLCGRAKFAGRTGFRPGQTLRRQRLLR